MLKNGKIGPLPRERLLKEGPEALSTCDLLALVLGRGTAQKNVFDLAKELEEYLSSTTAKPSLSDLLKIGGLGGAKASQILACLELSSRFFLGSAMSSASTPDELVPHLSFLKYARQESFVAVPLGANNGILGIHQVTLGLANRTQVHPREAFAKVIEDRAIGVIFAHNHPSGALEVSEDDKMVTRMLWEAGKILEIPVLDHLIVSCRGYKSLKRDLPYLFDA